MTNITDWTLEPRMREFELGDYIGAAPRWCPSCGNHTVLKCLQKLCKDLNLPPEKTVVVSGIGCSSRLPHHMGTYGFHSLHGRALPVACGIRARRPDLSIFVVTGDGDCCAIGAGHWLHALRYNMKMTVLLLDNNIYGLTKKQTSPTTPAHTRTNTHPNGAPLDPVNPIATAISMTNASFVAQCVDWLPEHLYNTLLRAQSHPGLSFIRIRQRCPHFMKGHLDAFINDTDKLQLLTDPNGVATGSLTQTYKTVSHDPTDIALATKISRQTDPIPLGLIYLNESAVRYDEFTQKGIITSEEEKLSAIEAELDKFAIT
ncbi:MAG: 2-oxoglutarate oxidoreductase [Proteobacteria bacterium]|nr:2-oxoglutarate oxidoreductase [Pseudomonadota bacterium]MBQ9244147.1 2-oxoglutarate oxidoreductase [Pseudomonadota bacterium]